jgi:hypothetical protein
MKVALSTIDMDSVWHNPRGAKASGLTGNVGGFARTHESRR